MCVGDYRLGRLIRPEIVRVVTPGDFVAFPGDTARVGLTFFPHDSDFYFIHFDSVDLSRGGYAILPTQDPWHITLLTHGDLSIRPFVINPFAEQALDINFIKYTLPERALQSNPPPVGFSPE